MQILVSNAVQWGLLLRQVKCYHFVTFLTVLSCPVLTLPFFLDTARRSNRWTDFQALWLKRRVSGQGWSFWGLERWIIIFGRRMLPNPSPKNGRK